MSTIISFADLTHTTVAVDANCFPLGCGFIAAYAKKHLSSALNIDIFKYPDDFTQYLDITTPDIACFSNYSWCLNLNYEFARYVKKRSPETITVFGGPNYPNALEEQKLFLKEHSAIDIYIDGEGEEAFVELFKALDKFDFSIENFKKSLTAPGNTHYISGSKLIRGKTLPRLLNLNQIPSPYLNGMMDKFFDQYLNPILQTTRGCPYSCAFCHDGTPYMTKTRRFEQPRINEEIEYVFQRRQVNGLALADLNFGIFEEDLETAKLLSMKQKIGGWPKSVNVTAAKNHKDRVNKIADYLGDAFYVSASVQSTDQKVLENIQRSNVSQDQLVGVAQASAKNGAISFSEVILGLPGDSKETHVRSVMDMLDAGMDEIRMYQFILLPGTAGGESKFRDKFKYQTRFRVLPRCFGSYRVYGEEFDVFEIHEFCVGSASMSFDEYMVCRQFNLMVEIFHNGGLLSELRILLRELSIPMSSFYRNLFEIIFEEPSFCQLFEQFKQDEIRNSWETKEELLSFLKCRDTVEKYTFGEYGANQIMKFRAIATVGHLTTIVDSAIQAARNSIQSAKNLSSHIELYLDELKQFILVRKGDMFGDKKPETHTFNFDFVQLHQINYRGSALFNKSRTPIKIYFHHPDSQLQEISSYQAQYGKTTEGIGHFFQRERSVSVLYRQVDYA